MQALHARIKETEETQKKLQQHLNKTLGVSLSLRTKLFQRKKLNTFGVNLYIIYVLDKVPQGLFRSFETRRSTLSS